MKYSLFLDDERFPPSTGTQDWLIIRTVQEAIQTINKVGMPWRMSLDHDLGEDQETGYDFIKWLIEQDLDNNIDIKKITDFYVHSQNPVGKENIINLYNNYKDHKNNKINITAEAVYKSN